MKRCCSGSPRAPGEFRLLERDPVVRPRFQRLFRPHDWIAPDSPMAAVRQCELILQAVEQLSRFPNSGRTTRKLGERELFVPGTPYIVRYRVIYETVLLIAIKHGAQRN